MTEQRIITELGAGTDLHGGNYTKAAIRAVEDAMRHSSLSLFRSMTLDREAMRIDVLIGVAVPEKVDLDAVAAILPYGSVTVRAVKGGLTAAGMGEGEGLGDAIIASAAVTVTLDIPENRWVLAMDSPKG